MIFETDIPDFLYHYTNIESLESILKNKTIRFSSLMNVDDSEEMSTSSNMNLGKYCFVSSWTDLEEESIPFWAQYTNNMGGVRIKLPTLPFKQNTVTHKYVNNGVPFVTFYPVEFFNKENIFPYLPMPFCRKIHYTNDNSKLITQDYLSYESMEEHRLNNIFMNLMDIGRYKRLCWSFQSEWRYCMYFLPVDIETGHMSIDVSMNDINIGFNHYDLPLNEKALENLEITLGPKIGLNIAKVQKIVQQYCPNAKLKNSQLKIR